MRAKATDAAFRLMAVAVVAALCACVHAPGDPRERLARYRGIAEPPVASFPYARNLRWEALGDQALAIWPSRGAGYLLEMASPCPGLDDARAIQISQADGRVRSRVDSVRVLSMAGSRPLQRPACPILLISPIPASAAVQTGTLHPVEP
ncbi:DUF6491 family protein [Lysobacter sp. LF1]|uniref:DUF6491 family protein n=1 Tax=Lysobacter stagni TaxID=3045172 RepID=A0ABT6XI42_9GAMM|nr:DUF6491 family protein [Lysobacter sp. LF1]MDI9239834.1 DUF6491 family protein [Lysobacter sp. LF1]